MYNTRNKVLHNEQKVHKEQEDRYHEIFDNSPVSIWEEDFTVALEALNRLESQGVTDLEAYFVEYPEFIYQLAQMIKIRDINNKTLQIFRAASKEELLGSLDKVIPQEGMQTLKREIIAIHAGKTYFEEETFNYTLDGTLLNIILSVSIPQHTARFDRILVSMMDITDRKQMERSLRNSEEKYRSIFHNTGTAMMIVEQDTTISLANRELESLSGYSKQEIEGQKSWTDFVAFETELKRMKQYHYQRRTSLNSAPNRYEFRFQDRKGQLKYISLTIDMIPGTSQSVASLLDITELTQAEQRLQQAYDQLEQKVEARTKELQKSESRLRRSQQVARVATWERDFQTGDIFWSDEQYRLFGYEPDELSEREILKKHISVEDLSRIRDSFYITVRENREFNVQFYYTTKMGEERIAHCLGQAEKDEVGNPLHIFGTMQDVTEKIETEQALQKSKEDYESLLLSKQHVSSYKDIIGKSKQMRQIYSLIQQLAKVDTMVLITGESGTGKELVAEALHYSSARAKGPLIKVNCAALSENLLESELFGHVRGAFTGAVCNKAGRIESAEGGTLFLDEIGEISYHLQLKLLRFLQEKQFERVGEVHTLRANVRIIAATNALLSRKVQEGSFRADLYYRLKVMPINIPPLRERTEDIPLLVRHFLQHFNREFNKKVSGVSEEAMRYFMSSTWPGNVRELRHILECACLFCPGGKIGLEHLPEDLTERSTSPELKVQGLSSIAATNKKFGPDEIAEALRRSEGNRSHAAKLLGISRRTLYRRLHDFELLDRKY